VKYARYRSALARSAAVARSLSTAPATWLVRIANSARSASENAAGRALSASKTPSTRPPTFNGTHSSERISGSRAR
jgi:hypothetical protein